MAIEKVREYLKPFGRDADIQEFPVSSATVELAAQALHTEPARIAKTISLKNAEGGCLLIVTAGDTKIDNSKFKAEFSQPAMRSAASVRLRIRKARAYFWMSPSSGSRRYSPPAEAAIPRLSFPAPICLSFPARKNGWMSAKRQAKKQLAQPGQGFVLRCSFLLLPS